jgi:hypothetical protein
MELIKRTDKKIQVVGNCDIEQVLKTPKRVVFPNGAVATAVPEKHPQQGKDVYAVKTYSFALNGQKKQLPDYALKKWIETAQEEKVAFKIEYFTVEDMVALTGDQLTKNILVELADAN